LDWILTIFSVLLQPILIAAAIDYTIHNGTTPGALGRKISADIRDQRIIAAAQDKDGHRVPALKPGMPGYRECKYFQLMDPSGKIKNDDTHLFFICHFYRS
jgi:hypothetical protein